MFRTCTIVEKDLFLEASLQQSGVMQINSYCKIGPNYVKLWFEVKMVMFAFWVNIDG